MPRGVGLPPLGRSQLFAAIDDFDFVMRIRDACTIANQAILLIFYLLNNFLEEPKKKQKNGSNDSDEVRTHGYNR